MTKAMQEKICGFRDFQWVVKVFPMNAWAMTAFPAQMKQKPQKFSLHSDNTQ